MARQIYIDGDPRSGYTVEVLLNGVVEAFETRRSGEEANELARTIVAERGGKVERWATGDDHVR